MLKLFGRCSIQIWLKVESNGHAGIDRENLAVQNRVGIAQKSVATQISTT